jgi:hypothetical protein
MVKTWSPLEQFVSVLASAEPSMSHISGQRFVKSLSLVKDRVTQNITAFRMIGNVY